MLSGQHAGQPDEQNADEPAKACPIDGADLGLDQNTKRWHDHMKSHNKTCTFKFVPPKQYCNCGEWFDRPSNLKKHLDKHRGQGHAGNERMLTAKQILTQIQPPQSSDNRTRASDGSLDVGDNLSSL